ncbi:MAG: DNA polymerase/3'-5' exonuclease PolX [Gemmatimonadota bacterium]|nr:DNA polymerase/3'-5' exonuclease PolX [Gemmatimonadota bacterium]
MDPRTAAHVLSQIGAFLELHGENRFKSRAYTAAARAVQALDVDDLAPMLRSGELAKVSGLGPATVAVIRDLVETGESSYLERLRESTPEGLLDMLRVPGLGPAKIHQIHRGLGIETVRELEEAARDGRLAKLQRFGPKTAEKILKAIAFLRETGARVLFPHALGEAQRLLAAVSAHPDVERAEIAGAIRRRLEIIRDVDIVAACRTDPTRVATSFARVGGVREAVGAGGASVSITFVDETRFDLYCVTPDHFAVALWRATGNDAHVAGVRDRLTARGLTLDGDELRGGGRSVPVPDEPALYRAAGLAYVPPELREGTGEIEAAARGEIPTLVEYGDIQGVLHCHSNFSDGTATIHEMARAARARGWRYLGISDHSESAFYAGGVSRDRILEQHDEIDRVNATLHDFRVLKGIEADILGDGRVDYDDDFLERFDYVIGSIHSRFGMDEAAMTARVLTALDNPHLTILGHPTGRLLLTREPYAIDMHAVLAKAGRVGVAVELNADPHRLDLNWHLLRVAKTHGVAVEIGPDAHSTHGLDNTEIGVGIARKGGLEASDVLNARGVADVLAFARGRRAGARGRVADGSGQWAAGR